MYKKLLIKTQMELSNLIGCPGHEEEVTDYILLKLEKLDEIRNILPIV